MGGGREGEREEEREEGKERGKEGQRVRGRKEGQKKGRKRKNIPVHFGMHTSLFWTKIRYPAFESLHLNKAFEK